MLERILSEHHKSKKFENRKSIKIERTDSSEAEWIFIAINFFKERINEDVVISLGKSVHFVKILEVDGQQGRIFYEGRDFSAWMEIKHIDMVTSKK